MDPPIDESGAAPHAAAAAPPTTASSVDLRPTHARHWSRRESDVGSSDSEHEQAGGGGGGGGIAEPSHRPLPPLHPRSHPHVPGIKTFREALLGLPTPRVAEGSALLVSPSLVATPASATSSASSGRRLRFDFEEGSKGGGQQGQSLPSAPPEVERAGGSLPQQSEPRVPVADLDKQPAGAEAATPPSQPSAGEVLLPLLPAAAAVAQFAFFAAYGAAAQRALALAGGCPAPQWTSFTTGIAAACSFCALLAVLSLHLAWLRQLRSPPPYHPLSPQARPTASATSATAVLMPDWCRWSMLAGATVLSLALGIGSAREAFGPPPPPSCAPVHRAALGVYLGMSWALTASTVSLLLWWPADVGGGSKASAAAASSASLSQRASVAEGGLRQPARRWRVLPLVSGGTIPAAQEPRVRPLPPMPAIATAADDGSSFGSGQQRTAHSPRTV